MKQKTPPKHKPRADDKYYRVILEEIDPQKETPESFAIKLSMKVRTPITRINHIIRNIPYPIKSGLTIHQASKFADILEELGGKVSLASYDLRHGEADPVIGPKWKRTGLEAADRSPTTDSQSDILDAENGIVCEKCGWNNEQDAEYCVFCFAKFQKERLTLSELRDKQPAENPLEDTSSSKKTISLSPSNTMTFKVAVFIGCIIVLLLLILRH